MHYVENFANGPEGWRGWDSTPGHVLLPVENGALASRGPWWVDYNHAPLCYVGRSLAVPNSFRTRQSVTGANAAAPPMRLSAAINRSAK